MPLARLQSGAEKFLPSLERFLAKIGPQQAISIPETIHLPFLDRSVLVKVNPLLRDCEHFVAGSRNTRKAMNCRTVVVATAETIYIFGDTSSQGWVGCLQDCFRGLATKELPAFLENLAKGYGKFKISIRNQKTRLGSCSFRGGVSPQYTVSLNWRSIFLPVHYLSHLCWHELTHMHHLNHSSAFYQELETKSAQCRKMEKELNLAWQSLPRWIFARGEKSQNNALLVCHSFTEVKE